MSVKVRTPKTKRLIAIFSVLTVLTAGAGGFVIWQLTKDVGSDRGRADSICGDSVGPSCSGGSWVAKYCAGDCLKGTYKCPDGSEQANVKVESCVNGCTVDHCNPDPATCKPNGQACSSGDTCCGSNGNCVGGICVYDRCNEGLLGNCDPGCSGASTTYYCDTRDASGNIVPGSGFGCCTKCDGTSGCVYAKRCEPGCGDFLTSDPNALPLPKICFDSQEDFTSGAFRFWTGLDAAECHPTVLSDPPKCDFLRINGASRHTTPLTITSETENLTLTAEGSDPDGSPAWINICVSVNDLPINTTHPGPSGWVCYGSTNGTQSNPTSTTTRLVVQRTYSQLKADVLGKNIPNVTEAMIDEQGLFFVTNVADNTANEFCSTNRVGYDPTNANGSGIYIVNSQNSGRCDGDYCVGSLNMTAPDEPICTNIEPKNVEIREARTITFTGRASEPGATEFRWRADTDCDGNVDEHQWVTNTVTVSTTNTQTFNFTPGGSTTVCRVELQVEDETATKAVCTYDIPYSPAGEIIVDKTGPICVERVAPNNIARFTVTVTIPTASEQDSMQIVRITDILPLGFRYVASSATLRIGGVDQVLGEPSRTVSADVETLIWNNTTGWVLNKGQQMILVFDAMATSTARTGENINEVVVEPKDGPPEHDEYPFPVEQTCSPVPVTGVMDVLPYIVTLGLLVLGIYLYKEDLLLGIPKVHINTGLKDKGKLIGLKLTRPKEYFEEQALEKLKAKKDKS